MPSARGWNLHILSTPIFVCGQSRILHGRQSSPYISCSRSKQNFYVINDKKLGKDFDCRRILEYSGTCVLWTPWDRLKVSRLSRCPDFPGDLYEKVPFGTSTKGLDCAGVHIFLVSTLTGFTVRSICECSPLPQCKIRVITS